MKKLTALILTAVFMLACTGCSDLEKEHFDKYTYSDMSGLAEIDESFVVTIDPQVTGEAIVEIMGNMSDPDNDEYDSYEEYSWDSDEYMSMFLEEILSSMRIAFDENKNFTFTVNAKGCMDFDNTYSDLSMTMSLNNLSLNLGNVYQRGDKVYMDKKYLYSICGIEYISDYELLGECYNALDEVFGDKEYVCMDYADAVSQYGNTENPVLGGMLQNQYNDLYEQAKSVLAGFNSGCVTKIENGTRFELNSDDFAESGTKFAGYIKQHSTSSAQLVNDYMEILFAASEDMYNYDEVTAKDVKESMDEFSEYINSPEYNAIFDVLNVSYVSEITDVDGIRKSTDVIKGVYNESTAFNVDINKSAAVTESYEFLDLTNAEVVSFEAVSEALSDAKSDRYYFNDGYSYSLSDYVCPDCGESFAYESTNYCNKCGFIHDYYEYDENCDKQPGCVLATEDSQVAA